MINESLSWKNNIYPTNKPHFNPLKLFFFTSLLFFKNFDNFIISSIFIYSYEFFIITLENIINYVVDYL